MSKLQSGSGSNPSQAVQLVWKLSSVLNGPFVQLIHRNETARFTRLRKHHTSKTNYVTDVFKSIEETNQQRTTL